jgi:predicted Zn-dependent protease
VSPASAYVVISRDAWTPVRWEQQVVPVFVDVRPQSSLPLGDVEGAVIDAINEWNAVDCGEVHLEYTGLVEGTAGVGIYVGWSSSSGSDDLLSADAAAITETYFASSGRIYRADMKLNATFEWTRTDGPLEAGVVDLQAVLTHELGHALGLGHSRQRDATMFFSGGGAPLRDLSLDDAHGHCFLYAPETFGDAVTCDSCTLDAQCSGGGACLYYPHGRAFCGEPCAGDTDCSGGYTCVEVPGVGGVCLANNEHCDESGSALQFGDYCYGSATCASAYCHVTPRDAYCSDFCRTDNDTCPNGTVCQLGAFAACPIDAPVDKCGVCVRVGEGEVGDPCWDSGGCASGVCLLGAAGQGQCSQPCANEAECPAGSLCALGFCVVPGPKPNGTPCDAPQQCSGAICVSVDTPSLQCVAACADEIDCGTNNICRSFVATSTCTAAADCRSGACYPAYQACICAQNDDCAQGQVCAEIDVPLTDGSFERVSLCQYRFCTLLEGKTGALGEFCNTAFPCRDQFTCRLEPGADFGSCRVPCDPLAPACDAAGCEWQPNIDPATGVCLPSTGAALDSVCGGSTPCAAGLACAAAATGAAEGTCRPDCGVALEGACAESDVCVDLAHPDYPGRGACMPAGTPSAALILPAGGESDEPPPPSLGPPGGADIDGRRYRRLADVSRGGSGGCSHGGPTGLFAPWLLVALGAVHRRGKEGP